MARVAALQLATLRRDFFCLSIYHLSVQASQHQPAAAATALIYISPPKQTTNRTPGNRIVIHRAGLALPNLQHQPTK